MYEMLLRTETLFLGLQAPVLLAVGTGAVVVGLVFWLGGARHSAIIIGLLGAVVGCLVGLLVGPWLPVNPWLSMLLGAVVLGGLSILLRNVLILVLAVLVFSAVGGAGYLSVLLDRVAPTAPAEDRAESWRSVRTFSGMAPADRRSYLEDLSQDADTFAERLKALLANTWEAARPHGWAMILAVAAGAVVGIVLIWLIAKIVIALAYSIVGTALIFLGLQAALAAVGVLLVSDLGPRRWLLPVAFLVQTVVGWLWQLFYAGGKRPKREPAPEASRADAPPAARR